MPVRWSFRETSELRLSVVPARSDLLFCWLMCVLGPGWNRVALGGTVIIPKQSTRCLEGCVSHGIVGKSFVLEGPESPSGRGTLPTLLRFRLSLVRESGVVGLSV